MRYSGMPAPSARADPTPASTHATNGIRRIRHLSGQRSATTSLMSQQCCRSVLITRWWADLWPETRLSGRVAYFIDGVGDHPLAIIGQPATTLEGSRSAMGI